MASDDLSFFSIRELGRRLRAGEFTSVQLARHFLERLERLGARYHAVVTLTEERAIEEAGRADRELAAGRDRGPLHGIPYGVKDLLATKDAPTTWGAEPYREQRFAEDATVVRRLGDAGAVLVAKLAMVELAGGMGYNHADASFTGPGLNPWNLEYWSGGSSSGPGSAVAAGLVPFAVGSETSGSILTPAAFCGLNGLRPTYGLVSRKGAMALCWTLDKLGPMARSAEDCALALGAMAGRDDADPTSLDRGFHWPERRERRSLRLGVPRGVDEKEQPEVRENFRAALRVLARDHRIVEDVEWPEFPWGPAVGTIVGAEGGAAFADLIEKGGLARLRCPRDRYAGYSGMVVFAVDYLQAMRLRAPMKREVARLYESVDVVVSPARASVAYPADKEFQDAYPGVSGGPALIPAGNLCGLPALCVPNGFGENRLPTSIAFLGPAHSEETLLALGEEYQRQTRWHAETPPGV